MSGDADNLVDLQWIALCAHTLRGQWPRVDVASIDEAALELWRISWLRELPGDEAAALWLGPLRR
jgi:hypothetical protein